MAQEKNGRFIGKTVLVTGASQGIGEDIALSFAREGARVALSARHEDQLHRVLHRLPKVSSGDHVSFPADLKDEAEVRRLMQATFDHFPSLDILVCNAGFQIECPSEDLEMDSFRSVMAVNLDAVVQSALYAIRYWRKNNSKGQIVVNSSVHQVIPKPRYLGYAASKGAIGNVVRSLALEYAQHGIRVNAVAPGAVITPINDAWANDPGQKEIVSRHIPMRRPGESFEISNAVCFLASDDASYITGQTLFVDGGLTLYADFEENWSS